MVRLIEMDKDFLDQADDYVIEALETHRSRLIPLFQKSYDCSARCYEESSDLEAAMKCAGPCNNDAKRLGEELRPWIDSYVKHLGICKKECLGKEMTCVTTCLDHKKADQKLLAQLAFIVKAFFALPR